ncbi:MAG: hypothetical protein HKN29_14460 [Rhodothermales bacterium]|nr:hypothetical protein [Rhodothermales bacterium]
MKRKQEYLGIAFLSHVEQDQLRREAGDDPDFPAAERASHRLREAVDAGRALEERELDDLLIALALVGGGASDSWRARLLARAEESGLGHRVEQVSDRIREVEAGLDASAHFTRLTGHRAAPPPANRRMWLAAASVLALVLAHGTYSRLTEDPLRKSAWQQWDPPRVTRTAEFEENEVQRARRVGYESRQTVLGLWPSYDEDALRRADTMLGGRMDPEALLERARLQAVAGDADRARHTLGTLPPGLLERPDVAELRKALSPEGKN